MNKLFKTLDSGNRRGFETGARRDIVDGKSRYSLLPITALKRWADLMGRGAVKYGDRNWEKGMPVSVFVDSAMRHLYQYLAGDTDEDHLAAVLFNIGGIMEMENLATMGLIPTYFLDEGASMATAADRWRGRMDSLFRKGYEKNLKDIYIRHGDVFMVFDQGFAMVDGKSFDTSTDDELIALIDRQLTNDRTGV